MPERPPRTPESSPLKFPAGSASEKGNYREDNEDAVFADKQSGAGGVFDGVGGAPFGEVASRLGAESTQAELATWLSQLSVDDARQRMKDAFTVARESIWETVAGDSKLQGMNTTACAAKLFLDEAGQPHVVTGNAGDSRAYLVHQGKIEQLTQDDRIRHINMLTNSLASLRKEPQIIVRSLMPGDRILLATDGLYEGLTDDEIEGVLQTSQNEQDAADDLVRKALATGKTKDNISAVVLGQAS